MRIYTKAGDLAFSTMKLPDGQPHFRLETYEREFDAATIETRITSPSDLFDVVLVNSVLRRAGYSQVNLDILYLMGARMDRAISWSEPFTLQLVANILNSCGFSLVRILDVHSTVATTLIRNSQNVLPWNLFQQVEVTLDFPSMVIPDKGAVERVVKLYSGRPVYCSKIRDMATGKLSSFKIDSGADLVRRQSCLIVDDICDGGGTFIGLAEKLKEAGAKDLYLFVTHGIFSRGTEPLLKAGFKKIFTTNSFRDDNSGLSGVVTIPFRFS